MNNQLLTVHIINLKNYRVNVNIFINLEINWSKILLFLNRNWIILLLNNNNNLKKIMFKNWTNIFFDSKCIAHNSFKSTDSWFFSGNHFDIYSNFPNSVVHLDKVVAHSSGTWASQGIRTKSHFTKNHTELHQLYTIHKKFLKMADMGSYFGLTPLNKQRLGHQPINLKHSWYCHWGVM